MTDTASPIEILLTLIGLVCLIVNVINLWDSHRLVMAVRARPLAATFIDRLAVAKRDRRNDLIRLIKQSLWVSVWALSLFIPAPIRTSLELFTRYISLVIITNQILLAYASTADRRDRRALIKRRRRHTIPLKETPHGPQS